MFTKKIKIDFSLKSNKPVTGFKLQIGFKRIMWIEG